MDFAETYDKYKFGESTNSVEGVNSARRKFADKRYISYYLIILILKDLTLQEVMN